MTFSISSFRLPKLFRRNESKADEKKPADEQAFVGYSFAGGEKKESLPNDLELNDYATHQKGVLQPAVESANQHESQRQAFINKLYGKTPDNAAAPVFTFKDIDYVDIYEKGAKNLKKKLEDNARAIECQARVRSLMRRVARRGELD